MPGRLILLLWWAMLAACGTAHAAEWLAWTRLPALPAGRGGHFGGTHNGALIVAGGSAWTAPREQGGEKIWLDAAHVLLPEAAGWAPAGALPEPRAYGATVETPEGLLLLGGTDGTRCFDDVLRLRWEKDGLHVERPNPDRWRLPAPRAHAAAALLGRTVYLFGGQEAPRGAPAQATAWALDLGDPRARWQEVPAWPGPARVQAACAVQEGAIFLMGGSDFPDDSRGSRTYFSDAYRFDGKTSWKAVAPLPHPVAAAPAMPLGAAHVLVFGGDTGHPEHVFSRSVLGYHLITDTWAEVATMPEALVTLPAAAWQGGIVLPGGEDRPGSRSGTVMMMRPAPRGAAIGALDYAAIAFYCAVVAGIGARYARRERSTRDYFLGGGRVPWWAAGLSIYATALSAITFLSIPARAFATDWVWLLANMGIVLIAPIVAWCYIPAYRRAPITTAYEFLETRFNFFIRVYGSLCFLAFQVCRVGIVLLLPALALSAATGLNVYFSILLMGLVSIVYTVMGGIEAVIWTDVIQAIVLLAGALLALVLSLGAIDGGLPAAWAAATGAGKLHAFNWSWDWTAATVWVVLLGNAFSNLYPATADQTVVQRYLTTPDLRAARRAVFTNALMAIPTTLIFFSLGTALWVFFRQHPEMLDPALKNDAILPLFVVERFPPGMKGLVIAGIFAASMSSLDSSMNSVASVLVRDYLQRWRRDITEAASLRAARIIVVCFGFFGVASASYFASIQAASLWEPFLKVLGMVGSGLAGIYALGIFTRRGNGAGAIAGAIASAAVLFWMQGTAAHFFLQPVAGFLAAFAVGYGFSLLVPQSARRDTAQGASS